MPTGIYRVDDGSTWYIDANSYEHARELWREACGAGLGDLDDEDNLEIDRVQLTEATKITVVSDDLDAPCSKCNTPHKEASERSLLEAWQENNRLPEDERAKFGALCNSEWP